MCLSTVQNLMDKFKVLPGRCLCTVHPLLVHQGTRRVSVNLTCGCIVHPLLAHQGTTRASVNLTCGCSVVTLPAHPPKEQYGLLSLCQEHR